MKTSCREFEKKKASRKGKKFFYSNSITRNSTLEEFNHFQF